MLTLFYNLISKNKIKKNALRKKSMECNDNCYIFSSNSLYRVVFLIIE